MTIIFLQLNDYILKAQSHSEDRYWPIIWQDDFNYPSIDQSEWYTSPLWGSCGDSACYANDPPIIHGILHLIADREPCSCTIWEGNSINCYSMPYTKGGIFSKDAFKYGYYEILCKIPELRNSQYTGKGFSPYFYMWPFVFDNASIWSEIDIFDIDAEFNLHTCNFHYSDDTTSHWILRNSNEYDFIVDFSNYHTFSCEWNPLFIAFYFDGSLIRKSFYQNISKLIPINFFIDNVVPCSNFAKDFDPNSLFSYHYNTDYIKVYGLTCDYQDVIDIPNFETYEYTVKQSITLSSNTYIPTDSTIYLRSSDYIEFRNNFTVPIGSDIYFIVSPCHECIIQSSNQ